MAKGQKILHVCLLILSSMVLLKHSNIPIITSKSKILNFIFLKSDNDGILLSIVTSYIVSLFFYLIVVYYPEKNRRKKISINYYKELTYIIKEYWLLIGLLFKNISYEKEWKFDNIKSDLEIINETFYCKLDRYDGYSDADVLFYIDNEKPNWDKYMFYILEELYDKLDNWLLHYSTFLNESELKTIVSLKYDSFTNMYTGKNFIDCSTDLKNGKGETFAQFTSLYMIRSDITLGKKTKLFKKSDTQFIEFVNRIIEVRKICIEKSSFEDDLLIKTYYKKNLNQFGVAIEK